jgi:hypothetical protein
MHQQMQHRFTFGLLSCFFVLTWSDLIFAAGPRVDYLYPAGGQGGQKLTIQAFGDFADWPVKVWCEQKQVQVQAEQEKGKFSVELAPDAVPGVTWLRFYNETGASKVRPFMVGKLPEREEVEPNETTSNAQVVTRDIVVNGRLGKSNDVDGFVLELSAGEKFTATLQGHAVLGSPMDAVMQVCEIVQQQVTLNPKNERIEAYVLEQNHDSLGLDPAISFIAPRAGRYLIRLFATPAEPDSTIGYAGKDSYVYRLTITAQDFDPLQLLPTARNEFPLVRASNEVEKPLSLPASLTQTFTAPDQLHTYAFSAHKGKKISLSSATRILGYLSELSMKVTDRKGVVLIQADKKEPNQELETSFDPPQDDVFLLQVRERFQRSGPRFSYQLNLLAPDQDFAVKCATEVFEIEAGKVIEIPLTVDRRHGFSNPIEIRAIDLPAGITAEPVVSEAKGESSKTVILVLKATSDAPIVSIPFTISASSGALQRPVSYATNFPLDQVHTDFWLAVRK